MNKIFAPCPASRTLPEAPPESAADGRVFKISAKGVPPVTPETWAQLKVAARMKRKGRRYPEIAEVAARSSCTSAQVHRGRAHVVQGAGGTPTPDRP